MDTTPVSSDLLDSDDEDSVHPSEFQVLDSRSHNFGGGVRISEPKSLETTKLEDIRRWWMSWRETVKKYKSTGNAAPLPSVVSTISADNIPGFQEYVLQYNEDKDILQAKNSEILSTVQQWIQKNENNEEDWRQLLSNIKYGTRVLESTTVGYLGDQEKVLT